MRIHPGLRLVVIWAALGGSLSGCSPASTKDSTAENDRRLTVEQIEGLRSLEEVLPVSPDTAAERYRRFDRATFYTTYRSELAEVTRLVDSLNTPLSRSRRVDTLSIDHTIEGFGDAASAGKTLYISSSYFYLFRGTAVLRSVVFHEFGHIHARKLDTVQRTELVHIWTLIRGAALFYLFRDGEYSGNARFGGHPEESPEELFASGFNLFQNKPDEIAARLLFVDSRHRELVEMLRLFVLHATL